MTNPRKITILISFSGEGGVERMVTNLIQEFVRQGYQVDLLLIKAKGKHLAALPPEVNRIKLGISHTFFVLLPLIRYLRQQRPEAILVAKHRAIIVALLAKLIAGVSTRIVGRLGTNLSQALEGKSPLKKWFWHWQMRKLYPLAEKIIPVSEGVAADVATITGLPASKLEVIRNPVITPKLHAQALEPVSHPWFTDKQAPVILGAGRFTRQKDFITLIEAFALVREQRDCRLVLLGEGRLRSDYEQLAAKLGVMDHLAMPGFAENPYPYMKHADLFVLSSRWEGSPNVLSEALALGTPVVATDCPSGPHEVLQGGRVAPLVPVADAHAMASAILAVLATPPTADQLTAAVAEYTAEISAGRYLTVLGMR